MLGHSCADCVALFAEMRSAITEAKSIAQDARALSRERNPTPKINEWRQIRELWESAHVRWVWVRMNLKNNLETHRSTSK